MKPRCFISQTKLEILTTTQSSFFVANLRPDDMSIDYPCATVGGRDPVRLGMKQMVGKRLPSGKR